MCHGFDAIRLRFCSIVCDNGGLILEYELSLQLRSAFLNLTQDVTPAPSHIDNGSRVILS